MECSDGRCDHHSAASTARLYFPRKIFSEPGPDEIFKKLQAVARWFAANNVGVIPSLVNDPEGKFCLLAKVLPECAEHSVYRSCCSAKAVMSRDDHDFGS